MAQRVAQQTLQRRGADYADEVRRLLDAALQVMQRTPGRARVADIVAEAGLSNDAFYRHFPSKDALVAALLDDGAERLRSYLEHQMTKERTPERRIRRGVEGVVGQADDAIADTTMAVLHNAGGSRAAGRHFASEPLAALLVEPLAELGSTAPDLDAAFVAHGVLGRLADHLWEGTKPTRRETDHLVGLCLASVKPPR